MDRNRFRLLFDRCKSPKATIVADRLFNELDRRYGEAHRRYHTGAHIAHCLQQMDSAAPVLGKNDAVEMAIWFHDAIWDPKASDNEYRSAELFKSRVSDVASKAFIDAVYRLIMITVHPSSPQMDDEKFLVDIDLSSFGMPWDAFSRDSALVREEFAHLSDDEFGRNHCIFLRSLLDRESIFTTEYYRERYEETARANMRRQLTELGNHCTGSV